MPSMIENLIKKHNISYAKLMLVRNIPSDIIDLLDEDCFCPCAGRCKGFCINTVSNKIHPINYIQKECFFNLFHLYGTVSKILGITSGRNSEFYLVIRNNKPYVIEILPKNVLHINYPRKNSRIYDVCLAKGKLI